LPSLVLDFAGFLGKFLLFGDSWFFVYMWVVNPFGSDLIFKVFEEVFKYPIKFHICEKIKKF
jgi:hypothetical protein